MKKTISLKTTEETEQLFNDFTSQRLDKTSWTHEAHLIVALMHLKQFDYHDALCRMRAGIILLNKKHETENNGQKGYHETLTILWITILDFYIRKFPSQTKAETVNSFLLTPLADRSLPSLFYEKEKVLSSLYRANFVPPDKLSLDDETLDAILQREKNVKSL
jgi:hypothetical protein